MDISAEIYIYSQGFVEKECSLIFDIFKMFNFLLKTIAENKYFKSIIGDKPCIGARTNSQVKKNTFDKTKLFC